jgi:hypothetical protein
VCQALEGQIVSCVPRSVFSCSSCVIGVCHAAGVKMEPVKVAKVIRSHTLSLRTSSSVSKRMLLTIRNDGVVLTKNVNAT